MRQRFVTELLVREVSDGVHESSPVNVVAGLLVSVNEILPFDREPAAFAHHLDAPLVPFFVPMRHPDIVAPSAVDYFG
ncbi:MAG: hypothetical protein WA399_06630 [Acidobacteriaceae bacterium]